MRAVPEHLGLRMFAPRLELPQGSHGTVLVLPGYFSHDLVSRPLIRALRNLRHAAHTSGIGWHEGPSTRVLARIRSRLARISDDYGEPVSIIGHSLGGVYARLLAQEQPERVRQVITLGSPYRLTLDEADASPLGPVFRALMRAYSPELPDIMSSARLRTPLPVPATSMYSRTDAIVPWRSCIEPPHAAAENIEVRGSHAGLITHVAVLAVTADRLAQPDGQWQPYRAPRALAHWVRTSPELGMDHAR